MLIISIALALLGLDVFATHLVLRDQYSENAQKIAQLLFVWLVPVIGPIAIWGMFRSEEKSPGKYRDIQEPDDVWIPLNRRFNRSTTRPTAAPISEPSAKPK